MIKTIGFIRNADHDRAHPCIRIQYRTNARWVSCALIHIGIAERHSSCTAMLTYLDEVVRPALAHLARVTRLMERLRY